MASGSKEVAVRFIIFLVFIFHCLFLHQRDTEANVYGTFTCEESDPREVVTYLWLSSLLVILEPGPQAGVLSPVTGSCSRVTV